MPAPAAGQMTKKGGARLDRWRTEDTSPRCSSISPSVTRDGRRARRQASAATDDAIRETAIGTVLLAVLLCAIVHRSYVGVVAIGCTLFKHLAWVLLHTDVGITDTHIFWGTLVLPLVGAFRPASSRATMAFGLFELRCDCRIGTIDVPIFYSPASILSARR